MRSGSFLSRVWRTACAVVGVEASPHDLRATHATWVCDRGGRPWRSQPGLEHPWATVTTTHYARSVVGRDLEIAACLDDLAKADEP